MRAHRARAAAVRSFLIETNDGKLVRKLAGLHRVVGPRNHQRLGQIPPALKITRVAGAAGLPTEPQSRSLRLRALSLSPRSNPKSLPDAPSGDRTSAFRST